MDKRTDIWAFGCVLFEMLTARKPFPGETVTDTVAAILEQRARLAGAPEPHTGAYPVARREVPEERSCAAASRHRRRAVSD